MLFLAVAGALFFLIYKKEVGLFMKQSDGKRGGVLLGTFVWACIGIGYCLDHYDDVPEAKLVSDAEIVLPDGYDISSQKVVKAYLIYLIYQIGICQMLLMYHICLIFVFY